MEGPNIPTERHKRRWLSPNTSGALIRIQNCLIGNLNKSWAREACYGTSEAVGRGECDQEFIEIYLSAQ